MAKDGTPSSLSNRPGIYRLRNGNTAEVWGEDAKSGNPLYPLYGPLPDSPEEDAWDTNGRNWADPSYDLIERIGPLPASPLTEAQVDDRTPTAATDDRDVDWMDVTGWGVFKGHAIPVDVARFIADKINRYHAHRLALSQDPKVQS